MITGSLSRRYAKALFSVGEETNTLQSLGKEITNLVEVYQNNVELKESLENAVFPMSQRKQVLSSVCKKLGLSAIVERFVLLLLERGRISSLLLIAQSLHTLIDEKLGQIHVKITSATSLDQGLENRLQAALQTATAKTILLEKREDSSLLGGIKIQIGDVIYDASILAKLENLKETLQHQEITSLIQKSG